MAMMFPAELLFAYILHSGKSGLHIFLGRYTIEQTDRQQKTIQLDRQTNRKSNRQIDEATFVCACVSIVTERQRNILLSKALFWYMYASVCEVAFRVLSVAITFCSNAQTAGPKDQESIDIRCNRHSSKPPPPYPQKEKKKKSEKKRQIEKNTHELAQYTQQFSDPGAHSRVLIVLCGKRNYENIPVLLPWPQFQFVFDFRPATLPSQAAVSRRSSIYSQGYFYSLVPCIPSLSLIFSFPLFSRRLYSLLHASP